MKNIFSRDDYEPEVWEQDEKEMDENLINYIGKIFNTAGCVKKSDRWIYDPQ